MSEVSHRLVFVLPILVVLFTSSFFLVFGFAQTEFIGEEQGESYEVAVGFLSGRLNRSAVLSLALNFTGQSAGS